MIRTGFQTYNGPAVSTHLGLGQLVGRQLLTPRPPIQCLQHVHLFCHSQCSAVTAPPEVEEKIEDVLDHAVVKVPGFLVNHAEDTPNGEGKSAKRKTPDLNSSQSTREAIAFIPAEKSAYKGR